MMFKPKILSDPDLFYALTDYGIEIPVSHNKVKLIFDSLAEDPLVFQKIQKARIENISINLEKNDLLRVHSQDYVDRLLGDQCGRVLMDAFELIGPDGEWNRYSPQRATKKFEDLLKKILKNTSGSYEASLLALKYGFCFYFGGGMHHGHYDFSHGFCPLNDVVIAAEKLVAERGLEKIWVIDVDVHKGDGTAALAQENNKIITLSIHMAKGWPLNLPEFREDGSRHPSFIPSDIDIPIDQGEEGQYLEKLEQGLEKLLSFGKADIAIVLLGADPFEEDQLESSSLLNLTLEEMFSRDKLIYTFLRKHQVPGAYLMAGGYGEAAYKVYSAFLRYIFSSDLKY